MATSAKPINDGVYFRVQGIEQPFVCKRRLRYKRKFIVHVR